MNLPRDLHANGATICMVTHDPRYADMADRTIHLLDGRVRRRDQWRDKYCFLNSLLPNKTASIRTLSGLFGAAQIGFISVPTNTCV